jgi:hypothetical protein
MSEIYNTQWFLSFDCATKTFAYILVKINFDHLYNTMGIRKILTQIQNQLKNGVINEDMINIVDKIEHNTRNIITILDGKCIDLIPGIHSKDIDTVERVKKMSIYVKDNIYPLIEHIPKDSLNVLIEFQMCHNVQSRAVSIGLIALFADYKVHFVNPSLKNKIHLSDKGHYSNFIQRYKNSYDANKKHALYNFKTFETVFSQELKMSDKLKGHIADSFMQIIGHLVFIQ